MQGLAAVMLNECPYAHTDFQPTAAWCSTNPGLQLLPAPHNNPWFCVTVTMLNQHLHFPQAPAVDDIDITVLTSLTEDA